MPSTVYPTTPLINPDPASVPFVTINEEQRVNLELTVRRPIVHRELGVDVQRAEEVREVEDDLGRVA